MCLSGLPDAAPAVGEDPSHARFRLGQPLSPITLKVAQGFAVENYHDNYGGGSEVQSTLVLRTCYRKLQVVGAREHAEKALESFSATT